MSATKEPQITTRAEWLDARLALLKKEKDTATPEPCRTSQRAM